MLRLLRWSSASLSFDKVFINFCCVCWQSNSTLIRWGDSVDVLYLHNLVIFVGSASTLIAPKMLWCFFSFSAPTWAESSSHSVAWYMIMLHSLLSVFMSSFLFDDCLFSQFSWLLWVWSEHSLLWGHRVWERLCYLCPGFWYIFLNWAFNWGFNRVCHGGYKALFHHLWDNCFPCFLDFSF